MYISSSFLFWSVLRTLCFEENDLSARLKRKGISSILSLSKADFNFCISNEHTDQSESRIEVVNPEVGSKQ